MVDIIIQRCVVISFELETVIIAQRPLHLYLIAAALSSFTCHSRLICHQWLQAAEAMLNAIPRMYQVASDDGG